MKGKVELPLEQYDKLKKVYDCKNTETVYRMIKQGCLYYELKTESELVNDMLETYKDLVDWHIKTIEKLHEAHEEIVSLEMKINKNEKPSSIIDRVLEKFSI